MNSSNCDCYFTQRSRVLPVLQSGIAKQASSNVKWITDIMSLFSMHNASSEVVDYWTWEEDMERTEHCKSFVAMYLLLGIKRLLTLFFLASDPGGSTHNSPIFLFRKRNKLWIITKNFAKDARCWGGLSALKAWRDNCSKFSTVKPRLLHIVRRPISYAISEVMQ